MQSSLLLEWSTARGRHTRTQFEIEKTLVFNWLRQRNANDSLVQSDARALIEYFEARLRQHGEPQVIDGSRALETVKFAIAKERDLKADQSNGGCSALPDLAFDSIRTVYSS
jgi:hypothetical protein